MKNLLCSLFLLAAAIFARAEVPTPDVGIDQKIGSQLPMNAIFRDDTDPSERPLGDYFKTGRPAIVVMGYFACPQLCTIVMNGLVESLVQIRPQVGDAFDVFFISVDPTETAALAFDKKIAYVRRYGHPESEPGWHFLTGDESSITAAAESVGFRYVYDEALKQYAHGSGFAVVTPTGKVSRYFYGIEFAPDEIVTALDQAAAGKEGSPVKELLLLCYHYNPLTGRFGLLIWRILQAGALLTIGGLAWFVIRNIRSERRTAA